jgi:hypothetical protein
LRVKYRNQISLKGDKPKANEGKYMASSSVADFVDRLLEQGIVINAWVSDTLVEIELPANSLPSEKD